ncbi:alpha/beta hydrolase [Frankia sp. AgB32]|uniref:alpha/beta hydrolase n=1 Tax=Frankia sp. AgB32 TaxID=631119 RepID=UPI0034D4B6D2
MPGNDQARVVAAGGRALPATVIVTGDRDGLRPSGEAFAADLRRHGVSVDLGMEPGTAHGHLNTPDHPGFDRTMSTFTHWLHAERA